MFNNILEVLIGINNEKTLQVTKLQKILVIRNYSAFLCDVTRMATWLGDNVVWRLGFESW